MKTIAEAISDLLFVRDTVVVPGLGAFVKKPTSALVNRVANYFSAPSCVIEFDAGLREDNDLIVSYVSSENDVSVEEAQRMLAIFVSDCFGKLKEGNSVVLNGLGTLRYDWHSDIVLEQDASSNFNSDAFGLCDFTARSVVLNATKDEIKAEIEQQQKEKNTPVTVDERAVHEKRPRRRFWPWVVLVLLILAGGVCGLYYYQIVDFHEWLRPQRPIVLPSDTTVVRETPKAPMSLVANDSVEEFEMDTIMLPVSDTLLQNGAVQAVAEPLVEAAEPIGPEAKIMVVAGCFSSEENACNLVNSLKGQGYETAFAEKRGSKWFVAYGRYHTLEEATEFLRKLKALDANTKAWIRK